MQSVSSLVQERGSSSISSRTQTAPATIDLLGLQLLDIIHFVVNKPKSCQTSVTPKIKVPLLQHWNILPSLSLLQYIEFAFGQNYCFPSCLASLCNAFYESYSSKKLLCQLQVHAIQFEHTVASFSYLVVLFRLC